MDLVCPFFFLTEDQLDVTWLTRALFFYVYVL